MKYKQTGSRSADETCPRDYYREDTFRQVNPHEDYYSSISDHITVSQLTRKSRVREPDQKPDEREVRSTGRM